MVLPRFPLLLTLLATPIVAPAQVAAPSAATALEPADARVALLPAALYDEQANVRDASDAAVAEVATIRMREQLGELLGARLVPVAGDDATCRVSVACARSAAREAGAPWVVMVKVSKTSNLIWLLTGQLIHVPTGRIVIDDSTELKGEPQRMTGIGARIFAERVARTVAGGGVTNDFPNGVPTHVGPSESTR